MPPRKSKMKQKKLVKEKNEVKREKEIDRIAVNSQKVKEATEKNKQLELEAALAAAKVNPKVVSETYVEKLHEVAKEAKGKVRATRELIANLTEIVNKASDIIDAVERFAEEATDVANNLTRVSAAQENLVGVAKESILKSTSILAKADQAFIEMELLSGELVQKKRNEDVETIKTELADLVEKALLEKGKAAEEAATNNPVESARHSAEKAKNLTAEASSKANNASKSRTVKVAGDFATKITKKIEAIAEKSKESKDKNESVSLAKEAEKRLKSVEKAKEIVEKAIKKETDEDHGDENSNELRTQTSAIIQEANKTIELGNFVEKSLNKTKISEAKEASQKVHEAVNEMKESVEKLSEPTNAVDAETISAVEDQVKKTKDLLNKEKELVDVAITTALKTDPKEIAPTVAETALETANKAAEIASNADAVVSKTNNEKAKSLVEKAVKTAQIAKTAAEAASEKAKLAANDSDTTTASKHALEAKKLADQVVFEAKVAVGAVKEAREELAKEPQSTDEIGKLKEDKSEGTKETEGEDKYIDSIVQKVLKKLSSLVLQMFSKLSNELALDAPIKPKEIETPKEDAGEPKEGTNNTTKNETKEYSGEPKMIESQKEETLKEGIKLDGNDGNNGNNGNNGNDGNDEDDDDDEEEANAV